MGGVKWGWVGEVGKGRREEDRERWKKEEEG